jgi:hypothetical protein
LQQRRYEIVVETKPKIIFSLSFLVAPTGRAEIR